MQKQGYINIPTGFKWGLTQERLDKVLDYFRTEERLDKLLKRK